jgi:hypothetical protein
VGKEVANDRVELVLFKDRGGMTRVGYDPQIGPGDILGDQYRMRYRYHVVISPDHQGRTLYAVQLFQGYMRLVKVKIGYFEFGFDGRRLRLL